MVQVSVEELEVLSQAVPRGHPTAKPVVVVHHAPASRSSVVGPQELAFGIVVENVRAALAEETVLVQAVLDVS